MKILLEKDDAQALLTYLVTKPFNEVYLLVPLVLNAPEVPEPPKDVKCEPTDK